MTLRNDLQTFYELMDRLEENTGGRRRLGNCDPATDRSDGGVYFFFEKWERRSGSGGGDRVVRVGKCTELSPSSEQAAQGASQMKWSEVRCSEDGCTMPCS